MKWRHLLKLKQKNQEDQKNQEENDKTQSWKQEDQKNQEENDKTQSWKLVLLWLTFFGALVVIISGIDYGIWAIIKQFVSLPKSLILIFSGAISLGITINIIIKGWSQVEQMWEWNVELFGKWVKTWKAGLHIGFPYFGFMKFKAVYMGEQLIRLFMSEKEEKAVGLGEVEFIDGSAPVEAVIYFKIVNAKKARYNIENLHQALEEKMDSAIRAFLGLYKIDEANTVKSRAHLRNILNGEYIEPSEVRKKPPAGTKYNNLDELKTVMEDCSQWLLILNSWGTMITGFALSDIILPEKIKEARQSVLVAEKEAEAAVHKKQTRITLAEGEEKGLAYEGTGIRSQVKKLITAGVIGKDAVDYLADRLKWKNVGEKGATVIIDTGGGGIPGLGAQLGAGFKAGSTPEKATDKKMAPVETEETTNNEKASEKITEQPQQ